MFQVGKQEQLENSIQSIVHFSSLLSIFLNPETDLHSNFTLALNECLWGNQADLSLNAKGRQK